MLEINEQDCVVDIVDNILSEAIIKSSSDVHLESMENYLRVRYRIDGILYDQSPESFQLSNQILSRIKVLSNIDIAQRRIPQDGKWQYNYNNNAIDLRVSTFPSVYGEKIVIRILDRLKTKIVLENLGFEDQIYNKFKDLINKAHGFLLVTGPTGSGKTTTLYAALTQIHKPEKNIITLEDPVEYHIDGITQGQINLGANFTFSKGIRALLRQDPDIVMVGEIRDRESAKIAIEASLTGHLVFSTLHTNDASSAIMRLMDMDIEPFLINAALTGVLAQRLVRKICNNCRFEYQPRADEIKLIKFFNFDLKRLFKGKGCTQCSLTGHKGRIGIFELLIMTDELRSLIIKNPKFQEIKHQAVNDGMQTLVQDAFKKIENGLITIEEFLRVIL